MLKKRRNTLAVGAAALVAVVGSAGAIAATGALSPQEESQAVVDDVAERLGVEPSELGDAIKAALKERVDAAVDAGRLTEAQAAELEERMDSDEVPLSVSAAAVPVTSTSGTSRISMRQRRTSE